MLFGLIALDDQLSNDLADSGQQKNAPVTKPNEDAFGHHGRADRPLRCRLVTST
jgi:hypothetical protein